LAKAQYLVENGIPASSTTGEKKRRLHMSEHIEKQAAATYT